MLHNGSRERSLECTLITCSKIHVLIRASTSVRFYGSTSIDTSTITKPIGSQSRQTVLKVDWIEILDSRSTHENVHASYLMQVS